MTERRPLDAATADYVRSVVDRAPALTEGQLGQLQKLTAQVRRPAARVVKTSQEAA